MKRLLLLFTLILVIALPMRSEDGPRERMLRVDLDDLAVRDTAYNQKIDVSVTNFSIAELVKGLAIANDLSIDVDFDRKKTITCNLIQQPVKDVLYFICTEKNINAEIVGDIVTLVDYLPPSPSPIVAIVYDRDSSKVSFDLSACRLDTLSRRFASATDVNLVVFNSIADREVSAFGRDMSVDDAVQTIAMVNGLYARQENGRDWILSKENRVPQPANQQPSGPVVSVYPMKYRTVDKVVDVIPAELKPLQAYPSVVSLRLSR